MRDEIREKSYALFGGLDLATPAIRVDPGRLIAGDNYEASIDGYRRIDGFERLDGQPAPSDASYSVLNFDAGTATITEGQTVTGQTSGATGKAIIDMVVSSGAFGSSNAAGYLVLTVVSGTFQDNENLRVGGVTKCVANGAATDRGALTDANDTLWYRDAIETARALISTVTGSGNIRGVWHYGGATYAFRDNAGGTACVMHKSSTSGWTQPSLGSYVKFTGGTIAFAAGQTVVGQTSGASGVVTRVAVRSGTTGASDQAGTLTFATITGGPYQNGENLRVGGVTQAVASGASAAITFPAGGQYEFHNHNFSGALQYNRMYGVNGVGFGFEWDGTVLMPIFTGMTTDTPDHVAAHKQHLFFSYPGGSLQNSGTADPYSWDVLSGAEEIALGEDITGLLAEYAGTLAIFGRNKVGILYGNNSSDFRLDDIATDAGAIEWSAQKIGVPIYLDDAGVRSLATTATYGGILSILVDKLLQTWKKDGATLLSSVRVRSKDQYRLFFSNGKALYFYFGRNLRKPEITMVTLGKTVQTICASEDSSGNEILLFGSTDGYIYEMDAGTSFDGSAIDAYARLAFNHVGSPRWEKGWHKAVLEVDASQNTGLSMTADFSYADPEAPSLGTQSFTVTGGGGFWDESNWDEFLWSSPVRGLAEAHIDGIGDNISVVVISSATYEEPHVLQGVTLYYSHKRLKR